MNFCWKILLVSKWKLSCECCCYCWMILFWMLIFGCYFINVLLVWRMKMSWKRLKWNWLIVLVCCLIWCVICWILFVCVNRCKSLVFENWRVMRKVEWLSLLRKIMLILSGLLGCCKNSCSIFVWMVWCVLSLFRI